MKYFVILFALFASIFTASSQDYFWVGGSGNWSDFANHWATTSGGATFQTSAPTSANDVFFDANSFSTTNQVVTLDVIANCNSMDWTGIANFPSIVGNSNDMNIYGSLTLAADMTADFSDVEFEGTAIGNLITSNGTDLGSGSITRLNGIGGEWTLQDNFSTNSLYISAGTFITNNNDVNSGTFFQTSGASTKVLTLGSSLITTDRWWMFGTNQTINAGTSKIMVSSFYGDNTGDGPFTYYDVEFFNYGRLYNTSTFNEITVPAGLDLQLQSGGVFTINNLVADGSKHDAVLISSLTAGSEATFNKASGSVIVSYVELQDIFTSGGATFTANNAVDNGNNTGWTINALTGQDYFWVGDGGNWSDYVNHWATTPGGAIMHTDYPDKLDNVFFDANSFTLPSQVVNNDLPYALFHNMDWTGVTNTPSLDGAFSFRFEAHGSVTFTNGMNQNIWTLQFKGNDPGHSYTGTGTQSIDFIYFDGDGTWDLLSDVYAGSFNHDNGTVNYNGVNVNCSIDFEVGNGASAPILNLGTSSITCRDFQVHVSSTPTVNIGTSSINVSRDFDGNGIALYDVTMNGTGAVLGSNTFEFFTITPGSSTSFEAGATLTVNQTITMDGTKANPINLSSDAAGVQGTIAMSAGTADLTFLVLQDLAASGGATFNATQTIDNGNNAGWNITGLTGSNYYWVGDSGNWSDFSAHWATTSGGNTFETTVPGILDNVIFDANSFSLAGEVITIDSDAVNFNDLDASASTMNFTISGSAKECNVYGSIDLPATVASTVSDYNFLSINPETLNFNNGPGAGYDLTFKSSGNWTLGSALSVGTLTIEAGTINTSNYGVTIDNSLSFLTSNTKTLNLGTSAISAGTFSANTAENVTFNGGSSEISVETTFLLDTSPTNTITLNNVTFVTNSFSNPALLYDDMNVNTFTIVAGVTLKPVGNLTITTNDFVAVGTAADPIAFVPQTAGASLTISQASGTVNAYYLEIQDVTATGGATFNAFSSIDNGNAIGWVFTRQSQTISFTAISDKIVGDADFELAATASSGLGVSFSVISGDVSIAGTTVTINGGGPVQISASQAGDIDYDPAPSVINSFTVAKLDQVITFDPIPTQLLADGMLTLTATGGSSPNAITFTSSDLSVATISGATVTFVGVGTTTITAQQLGDATYNDAVDVQQDLEISVGNVSQTITFNALASNTYGDLAFDLTATASSSLTVSYASSDASVATISGSTVTVIGVGTTSVTTSQAGNNVYNPATDVLQDLVVVGASLTATAENKNKIYGDANPALTVVYTGFVNGEDETVLVTSPTVSTTATASTDVGVQTISVAGGSADNYQLNLVEGTLTIDKRALTATADDISIREGDAIPTLTISYTDLVNGDVGSEIDIPPATATTASSTSPVGDYPITLSGGEDNNYLLSLVDGVLTVDVALAVDEVSDIIRMYPNPVSSYLFVESAGEEYELELRSLSGKLIETYTIKSSEKIDLRSETKGIYLLILKEEGIIKGTSRLVVE